MSGTQPHAFARRLSLGTRKRSQGDGAALSSVSRTLKRSRSARTTSRLVKDASHDGGSPYKGLAAFAMSSPDLATPSEEWAEWCVPPSSSQRPAEVVAVIDNSRGIPDSDARAPVTERIPPLPPTRPARMREESAPINEQTRQAFRAEALAKLTTPTPTPMTELDGFPFPPVEAALGADVLAAPDADAQAATHRMHGTSISLSRLGTDSAAVPPALSRANTVDSHPDPVPLDIDLRGRLVRARNSPRASDSPGLTISSRSSTPSDLTGPEGPEWISSRESRTSTLTVPSSEEASPPRPSSSQTMTGSPIAALSVVDEDATNPAQRPRMPLNRRSIQKPVRGRAASDRLVEDAPEDGLKEQLQASGRTKDEISQLSNEVTFLQKLSHPAVVKYEGVVRTESYLNIILEFVENGSLQQTLKQFGQLPEGLVAGYVAKILEGLAYLHAQGVVHCDLKAANVLSTKNGNIKLSDFGVSLQIHAIKTTRGLAAAANDINGTPNWMAPEVISMVGATPASDIWSLAATICELISGHPPYHDLVALSAMFRIVEDEMPPLPESASPELQDFLKRCFSKLPQQRPTAAALFTHPWLLRNARDLRDLRPQDSLPLFRRYTVDTSQPAAHGSIGASNASARTRQPTVGEISPRIDIPLHNVLNEASSPASSGIICKAPRLRQDYVEPW
ncbi:hypothetical protein B0A53_02348 [Rhodotorula sp. CCFEE 5036]|nr:hypothetical protein B0A53_02348 [Rhodotorula sp. CCFEE 5036]